MLIPRLGDRKESKKQATQAPRPPQRAAKVPVKAPAITEEVVDVAEQLVALQRFSLAGPIVYLTGYDELGLIVGDTLSGHQN
jgi:hypothetical protein